MDKEEEIKMENYVREKSEEMINKIKKDFEKKGVEFTKENELIFRLGMSFGITLSSLALAHLPFDIIDTESESR